MFIDLYVLIAYLHEYSKSSLVFPHSLCSLTHLAMSIVDAVFRGYHYECLIKENLKKMDLYLS